VTFKSLKIHRDTKKALAEVFKYETMTPVQVCKPTRGRGEVREGKEGGEARLK
jgi:hypothetical protein